MQKKRFSILLAAFFAAGILALAVTTPVLAGPPAPIDIPITQPDGSQITARQWGDEWQNGLQTTDGYTIVEDPASGFMVYAERAPDGTLAPALLNGMPLIPGRHAPSGLEPMERPAPELAPQRAPRSLENAAPVEPEREGLSLAPPAQSSGNRPMLVILAEFNNRTGSVPPSEFQKRIFGATNSVRDYYYNASYSKLNITKANENSGTANDGIVGWVTLPISHPNGLNTAISHDIARRSLMAADSAGVNYAAYDTDGDGYVTAKELQVIIIAAGYDASYDSWLNGPATWAHQWDLDGNPLRLDGKWVGQNSADGDYGGYAIFGELHGDHYATIGVMAHEIGHLLGWPDLYDTDPTQDWEGVGKWSIMGSGSWNGIFQPGDAPSLPDAWSKWYQGWLEPVPAKTATTFTSTASGSTGPNALLIGSNPNGVDWAFYGGSGKGEYWLVEKRTRENYDVGLPGCGLLVWHVDETVTPTNSANANPWKPLLALEQADGYGQLSGSPNVFPNRGDGGDPYPGTSNILNFNNNTNPNSRYNSGTASMRSLEFQRAGDMWDCSDSMAVRYNDGLPFRTFIPSARQGMAAGSPEFFDDGIDLLSGGFPAAAKTPRLVSPRSAAHQNAAQFEAAQDHVLYLPLVAKGPQYATGQIRSSGTPLAGGQVQIMYSTNSGGAYAPYGDPALTDAEGRYRLRLPPLQSATSRYYVLWTNIQGNSTRLSSFECNFRTGSEAEHTCSFDVIGINLLNPPLNAVIVFPRRFEWTPRAITTDNYSLQLYNNDGSKWVPSGDVGYTDRVTMIPYPPGAAINTGYFWSVRVKTPPGVGFAFEKRAFSFSSVNGPSLNAASGIGWHEQGE